MIVQFFTHWSSCLEIARTDQQAIGKTHKAPFHARGVLRDTTADSGPAQPRRAALRACRVKVLWPFQTNHS